MTTVFLLLARHGPNDKGEVVSVHLTQESAIAAKDVLDRLHGEYTFTINMNCESVVIPPYFTATLVVEEREVKL